MAESKAAVTEVTPNPGLTRREEFALGFGAAIISRQSGRTPSSLAREVVPMVDAFLEELDKSKK